MSLVIKEISGSIITLLFTGTQVMRDHLLVLNSFCLIVPNKLRFS